MSSFASTTLIKTATGVSLAAVLVAGCASSKKAASAPTAAVSTAAAAAAPAASTSAASAAAAPAPSAAASSGTAATVSVKTGSLGTYLTDGAGRALYLYTPDTSATSTCYGQCVAYWPALTTSGAPQAGAGATASLLGTSPRTDGTTQVTYAGHPVYYFAGDKTAGATAGQGKEGTWWLLDASGAAIKTAASS